MVAAKDTRNGNQNCMCKFITSPVDYTRELQLHDMLPEVPCPIPGIAGPHFIAAQEALHRKLAHAWVSSTLFRIVAHQTATSWGVGLP